MCVSVCALMQWERGTCVRTIDSVLLYKCISFPWLDTVPFYYQFFKWLSNDAYKLNIPCIVTFRKLDPKNIHSISFLFYITKKQAFTRTLTIMPRKLTNKPWSSWDSWNKFVLKNIYPFFEQEPIRLRAGQIWKLKCVPFVEGILKPLFLSG